MEYRTFQEWSAAGYKINRGAKAAARSREGTPLFSSEQVTYSPPRSRSYRPRRNFYDGGLRGEQAHYEADRDYDNYDDPFEDMARDAAWGLD